MPFFIRSGVHFPVKNIQETLDYYRNQLGFHDAWTFGEKDGGIQRDDLRLLFAEDPSFVEDKNNDRHRLPVLRFVYETEAICEEFTGRGVVIAAPLTLHAYVLREFAFTDINGYYVRVAEVVSE